MKSTVVNLLAAILFLVQFPLCSLSNIAYASGNEYILDQRGGELYPTDLESQSSLDGTNNYIDGTRIVDFLDKLLWSIVGGFIGALIALLLEKVLKNPVLEIIAAEGANQDHVYPEMSGRWKFFRVNVTNKPLPVWLKWVVNRNTAQQVNAIIRFVELNKTMKGRWANTLELSAANQADILRLVFFPEPQTIYVGEHEYLDVFTKYENDLEAYGWNNEAYLISNKWRTKSYRLDPGDYTIEILLSGVNCQARKTFRAHIANSLDQTYIRNDNG